MPAPWHGTARLRPGVPWRPRDRNGECVATIGAVRRSADRDSIWTSGLQGTLKWGRRKAARPPRLAACSFTRWMSLRNIPVHTVPHHWCSTPHRRGAAAGERKGVARSSTATRTRQPWWLAMCRKVPARYPEETRQENRVADEQDRICWTPRATAGCTYVVASIHIAFKFLE